MKSEIEFADEKVQKNFEEFPFGAKSK